MIILYFRPTLAKLNSVAPQTVLKRTQGCRRALTSPTLHPHETVVDSLTLQPPHLTKATGGGSVARRPETSSKALAMDNPPNANIHTIVKAQIVFLLSTLTEDNFDRNQIEIRSVSHSGLLEACLSDKC